MFEFASHIQGIPCIIRVTSYQPGIPAIIGKCVDHSWPPEPSDYEYEILDRKGYPAPWLEEKESERDKQRLADEIEKQAAAEAEPDY